MDKNRKTAYQILLDVETKKAYSNLALNHQIAVHKPDSPAFVRHLVYGVLENKILLDWYINCLIPREVSKVKKPDLTILRMGVYQLLMMDSVPDHAAVSESVDLAKKYARGRSGFVNGVLRSCINRREQLRLPDREEDEERWLSIRYSCEPWIVRLWLQHYDVATVEAMLSAGAGAPELAIRVNRLKTGREELIPLLEEAGFTVSGGVLADSALRLSGSGDLTGTQMYRQGLFSIQDEASQFAAQMLDPQRGDVIADVCAAPGGKTLAIAERLNNTGMVIASDIYKRKVEIISREAERLGLTNVQTRTRDASREDPAMVGKADRVIVDAPCSGLGVIRRKPEIKYKARTEEMEKLPARQRQILAASSGYVKPGGVLLYCTCTIDPAENEDVVAAFLREHTEFRAEESRQLLPGRDGTDGFFLCRMRREDV